MQRTGIRMREVPYKTSAHILTDASAGRIDFVIDNVVNVLPGVQGGRLRPLAVTTSKRVDAMADVPTLSETAIPGLSVIASRAPWASLIAATTLRAHATSSSVGRNAAFTTATCLG